MRNNPYFAASISILLLSLACLALTPPASASSRCLIRIHLPAHMEEMKPVLQSLRASFDVTALNRETRTAEVIATDEDLPLLRQIDPDASVVMTSSQMDEMDIDDQYLNPSEVGIFLSTLELNFSSLVKRHQIGITEGGFPIWAVKISDNVLSDEDEPAILIMGTHQAREIMPVEVCTDAAQYLLTQYSSDPVIAAWVNTFEIWVVPLVNPEGNQYCWTTDPWWIKNRCDNGDGTFGVDIGHNYPFRWGACFGSSDFPGSTAYRGPSPASEPETQAIMNLVSSRSFIAALSYHSFDEMVLSPYGCHGSYTPDRQSMQSIGSQIASVIQKENGQMGYDFGTWWEKLYSNDGCETDWLYAEHGIFNYAIEVNTSYQPPYSIRDATVQRNRAGWRKLLEIAYNGSQVRGYVYDACTGEPLQAVVGISDVPLTEEETPRTSDPVTGWYQHFIASGNHNLEVHADGYVDLVQPVSIGSQALEYDIQMLPVNAYGLQYISHIVDDVDGDHDFVLDPGETSTLGVCISAPAQRVTGISAILEVSDPYLMVMDDSATFPDADPGQEVWAQGDCFRIWASPLTPEDYTATFTLTFSASETLCADTAGFTLTVRSSSYLCPYWVEMMDSNPGWTIQNGDAYASPFWMPSSGPASAYTGSNVYATNLSGPYNRGPYYLTTPPIDCSNLTGSELKYARYLYNEANFDLARVDVSSNGYTWHTVWSGYAQDSTWLLKSHDISNYADGYSSVYIRFSLIPDNIYFYDGFYIDDVMICGSFDGPLPTPATPTPFPTATPSSFYTRTPTPTGSSFTSTPSSTPSPSSTSSRTPTPTPTSSSAATFTITPSPTSTPTLPTPPTFTPSPPPSGTPSITPTTEPSATPTEKFIVDLTLNQNLFTAGDWFELRLKLQNSGPAIQGEAYLLLDVYGMYYFWPSWSAEADHKNYFFRTGFFSDEEILAFEWPSVSGSQSGLFFWAGCLEAGTSTLLGSIDYESFGYH